MTTIFIYLNHILLIFFRNSASTKSIIGVVHKYLEKNIIYPNKLITGFQKCEHPILHDEVKAIIVGDIADTVWYISNSKFKKVIYLF